MFFIKVVDQHFIFSSFEKLIFRIDPSLELSVKLVCSKLSVDLLAESKSNYVFLFIRWLINVNIRHDLFIAYLLFIAVE